MAILVQDEPDRDFNKLGRGIAITAGIVFGGAAGFTTGALLGYYYPKERWYEVPRSEWAGEQPRE